MFQKLMCRFERHKAHRRRVWHDGVSYRAPCEGCDVSLIRDDKGWRRYDRTADADTARHPHPAATPTRLG